METRNNEIYHHGTPGQKWGQRLYQNPDGSLTALGRLRYLKRDGSLTKAGEKRRKQLEATNKSIKKKYNEDNKANNNMYKQLTGKSLNRRGGGKNTRELLSEKDVKDMSDGELQKYYNRLSMERNTLQTKQQNRELREKEAKEAKYDKMSKGQKFIKKMIDDDLIPSVKRGVAGGISKGIQNTIANLITKTGDREINKFLNEKYNTTSNSNNKKSNNSNNNNSSKQQKKQEKNELKKDLNKDVKDTLKEFREDAKALKPVISKYLHDHPLKSHIDYAKQTKGRSYTEDILKNKDNIPEADWEEVSNETARRQEIANKERKKLGFSK